MAEFVLVHGGTFGAWCWDALRAELAGIGHRTWAPDLPIEDTGAGIEVYADLVTKTAADAGPEAILVGHSMGGRVIPFVAMRRPVGGLIFLCATIPGHQAKKSAPGSTHLTDEVVDVLKRDAKGRLYYRPEDARRVFFNDCPAQIADAAIARLRPQAILPIEQSDAIQSFPDVPMRYVVCSDDRALKPDYGRAVARDVLNTTPVELATGHSPFLSRPGELARVLNDLAMAMASESVKEARL